MINRQFDRQFRNNMLILLFCLIVISQNFFKMIYIYYLLYLLTYEEYTFTESLVEGCNIHMKVGIDFQQLLIVYIAQFWYADSPICFIMSFLKIFRLDIFSNRKFVFPTSSLQQIEAEKVNLPCPYWITFSHLCSSFCSTFNSYRQRD